MLDLTAFWLLVWGVRDELAPTYRTLVVGLAISGLYYLAASMIFPQEGHVRTHLDQHYARIKAKVLGALVAYNFATYVAAASVGTRVFTPLAVARMGAFAALVLAVILIKNRAVNLILLGLLCAIYLAATL